VAREVVLAGGAFNSPQLLMLSGTGPRDRSPRWVSRWRLRSRASVETCRIATRSALFHEEPRPWACLRNARFAAGDPGYREWLAGGGMYISNGAAVAFALRSNPRKTSPDSSVTALVTRFSGYFPAYSDVIRDSRDDLTFAVLKAHTNNTAGSVTQRSRDPRDPPRIDFRYVEEGNDQSGGDLAAVVEGIRRFRKMPERLRSMGLLHDEDTPGAELQDNEQLGRFVREHAWGHHASCTCAIGRPDGGGVLSSDFRVHGTHGLRVVDASAFPRIPGFFIACATFMIREKAADAILEAAKTTPKDPSRGDVDA
jgi:choline dehydrogenase